MDGRGGQDHIQRDGRGPAATDTGLARGVFHCWITTPDGVTTEKWIHNRIVNVALRYLINAGILGTEAVDTSWYLGLTTGSPSFVATDVLANHPGWTEFTGYTGLRKQWYGAALAGQSGLASNWSNRAQFVLSSSGTVGGAFMCSVTGGTGILWGGGPFDDGDANLPAGTTITVEYVTGWQDDGV